MVYYEDDLCIAIYDRFPKAKYHLLLVAKVMNETVWLSRPLHPGATRFPCGVTAREFVGGVFHFRYCSLY